jgi:hypothetical protein
MLSLKVVADGIGLAVTRTLVEWQVSPEQAEEVRAGVEFVVAQAEKSRLVEELTHSVVAKRYEEVAAEYRVKNGDHIKTQLTELFEADGTFKRTAAEAKAAVTAELQQEVVGGYRNKVVEEMHTSGEADEIRQQMLVDYATSQQALEVRRAVEEELRDSLMPGVQAEVKQNIVREVAAGEGAKRAELNDELADGREMTEFRKEETRRFTSIWEKATLEELKEKASTDAERAAIQKRIDQITHEASEVEAARVWCELLNAYKKQGIDTSVIESGTNVVIYLDGENAARMVKKMGARKVIGVSPVLAMSARELVELECDSIVSLLMPENFRCVADYFEDFTPVTDAQVVEMLGPKTKGHRGALFSAKPAPLEPSQKG